MKKNLCTLLAMLMTVITFSQDENKNLFSAIYPIGDQPNIGYKSSMVPEIETILFEANPILRMHLYNNIREQSMSTRKKLIFGKYPSMGSTFYFAFRPQFRMYTDNSRPVKMPTYKISIIGFQKLLSIKENHLLAFSLESGHFSNGQPNCAFSSNFDDGSPECDSIYYLITSSTNLSQILNRESGNFSTNYTEFILNYRIITELDEETYIPRSGFSFTMGWNRYHNKLLFLADIGGYTENDIKIYGKNRFTAGIDYLFTLNDSCFLCEKLCFNRISFGANAEYISTPHPFVNPIRIEVSAKAYFANNVGFFISGIYGHDNYNYRFVDSGTQIFAGLTFDIFPPIEIK